MYTFEKEWSLCIVQDGANGTDGLSIGIASQSAVIYADADGYTTSAVTIKPVISAFKGSSTVSYSANSGDSITVRMRDGTVRLIRANISPKNYPPTWDIPKDAKLMPSAKALSITVTAEGQTVNLSYGYVVLADGADGDDYVLTEQDKQDIAELVDVPVDDVQINGSSIVSDGVANIPMPKTVNVSGTTPTINAQADTRYVCGEVATLDFTPPASGICDVVFTSGATPTVVTLPNTVKFPDGAFTAEADTTYEINILDGIYGAVMAWT